MSPARARVTNVGAFARIAFALVALLALVARVGAVVDAVDGLPRLDDRTFERETQATSGSTTGAWLVLFANFEKSGAVAAANALRAAAPALLERGVIAASVDISSSPEVVDRFRFIVKRTPSYVLIESGRARMKEWRSAVDAETLERFATTKTDEGSVPVPVQLTYAQRIFAKMTNGIAIRIVRSYHWFEEFMQTMSRDFKAAREAFRKGGFRLGRQSMGKSISASSQEYGLAMVGMGIVIILFAAALAIATNPSNQVAKESKSKTE